jgi:hypothetical protein
MFRVWDSDHISMKGPRFHMKGRCRGRKEGRRLKRANREPAQKLLSHSCQYSDLWRCGVRNIWVYIVPQNKTRSQAYRGRTLWALSAEGTIVVTSEDPVQMNGKRKIFIQETYLLHPMWFLIKYERLLAQSWPACLPAYSCCSHLEHKTSVKRFVSLQFLNLRQSVGLFGRGISPTQGRYLNRPTQTQNKCRQTSMPWVGFEPMIPAFERAKAVHDLDRAITVIGRDLLQN